MANFNDSREAKKERLRQNIVTSNNTGKDAKRPSPVVFILIIAIIVAAAGGLIHYLRVKGVISTSMFTGSSYTIEWTRSVESDLSNVETFKDFKRFRDGIIKYTKDGAEYIDAKGNVVWERSYQLNSPVIDVSDEYAGCLQEDRISSYLSRKTDLYGGLSELRQR